MGEQLRSHQPCNDCGSSDALTYYDWGSMCFKCGKTRRNGKGDGVVQTLTKVSTRLSNVHELQYESIKERSLTRDTCLEYGIGTKGGSYYFPYYSGDDLVAFKKRQIADKRFSIEGDWNKGTLFGQQLFAKGGKYVTITEGEFDAAAAYQMLGSKYPVVSVRNGAGNAAQDIKNNYEWLDTFENVVICFDNDDAGRVAATQVAEILGTKAKIFKGTKDYKDACEFAQENKVAEFVNLWWKAERYTPDGIIDGSVLWDLVNQPVETAKVQYPFAGLNDLTYGIREGELVTITAGSGLGKSQFLREIVFHILNNTTEENIGLMFLEESVKRTAKSIMSLAANKPLHLPDVEATKDELRDAFDSTLGTGRVYLFDHFGSTAIDNIINRVRFMAKALDCRYVFLDHVSIVVSDQSHVDERKALEEIMTKLRMTVQETGIALFCVSHLKRPDGKGHEEGAATSLSQLRGTAAIGQLSDMVLGLERNGQAEDLKERHTTRVRVLKNRFAGLTGHACGLYYDRITGRMTETVVEEL
jgi:twinkle protein